MLGLDYPQKSYSKWQSLNPFKSSTQTILAQQFSIKTCRALSARDKFDLIWLGLRWYNILKYITNFKKKINRNQYSELVTTRTKTYKITSI